MTKPRRRGGAAGGAEGQRDILGGGIHKENAMFFSNPWRGM